VDAKLGVGVGEMVPLGLHDYRVVGLTRGAVDSGGNPLLYLSLADAQEVLYQPDNRSLEAQRAASRQALRKAGASAQQTERLLPLLSAQTDTISAVLVKLTPGSSAEEVAAHIEDWLYFSVYTTGEEVDLMLKGRLQRMSAVLGLFRSLLVLVSIVIMALLMYVLTIGKIKAIATLKLIGASNWVIVRMILEQALVLTVGSFGFAYLLAPVIESRFPRTLVMLPSETLITFLVLLAGGLLASLVGIWHALRTPPSEALGA
jgi:putative ABC transport system permease protein